MDNECTKLFAPKPKIKSSSSKFCQFSSKTPINNKSPITKFNFSDIPISTSKLYKTKPFASSNILKDFELEFKKDFEDLSVKSEIFSILQNDINLRSSNISNSTAFSKNGIFNSNDFFTDDLLDEDCKIVPPNRSPNPLYRNIDADEDIDNCYSGLEFKMD